MNTYIDNNFLSGQLKITSNIKNNTTIGRLSVYDIITDSFIEFNTITTCKKPDIFNEQKGINIVKLKLAKQYYFYQKQQSLKLKNALNKKLNKINSTYNNANKKLNNINKSLNEI